MHFRNFGLPLKMSAVPDDQKNTQTDTNLLPQNKDDLLQYYKDRIGILNEKIDVETLNNSFEFSCSFICQ